MGDFGAAFLKIKDRVRGISLTKEGLFRHQSDVSAPSPALKQNQNKRALTKSLKSGFFLRKKPLSSLAFGVQLF